MADSGLNRPAAIGKRAAFYYILFFLSGVPALLYQIVWQRALFTFYGVNIESVTVIVTAFMLGLGLGSLAGGRLSKAPNLPLLALFGAIEIGIGLFGFCSLSLFHQVALMTARAPLPGIALITMCMLLLPTLLMGSTLPLLVAHFVRTTHNVGESVGGLYAVNTFGSAVACFLAAFFAMRYLGETGTVRAAAALNIVAGSSALCLQMLFGNQPSRHAESSNNDSSRAIPFRLGLALSGVAGFIALAYEIIWYRIYSFAARGTAPCFALLLGCYLGGIAYGSLFIRDLCSQKLVRDSGRTIRTLVRVIIWASIASFLLAPALAFAVRYIPYFAALPFVFVAAALLGSVFPLLAHATIAPADEAGSRISYVYLANIVGAASGSFAVGFVGMDRFSPMTLSLILLVIGVATALLLARNVNFRVNRLTHLGFAAVVLVVIFSSEIFSKLYERLLYQRTFSPGTTFQQVVETRSGVAAVTTDGTVFGGGVYDGRFNTDPIHDSNGIFRAYAIDSFHPHPAEALMIGLSSGSWAQVIASNPRVSHLTVVEINPGYLRLIPQHPQVASVLHNPKVEIVIDDGRRWLVRNPDRKFDLVVMNTTYHWRAHASNLLSVEFLKLVRLHLKPGGVHYYNTTGSGEVQLTGASVFPYALRVWTFLAVSDRPIQVDKNRWEMCLMRFKIDGRPVFDLSDGVEREVLSRLLSLAGTIAGNPSMPQEQNMESGASIRERWKGERLITDDNMGTEWQ